MIVTTPIAKFREGGQLPSSREAHALSSRTRCAARLRKPRLSYAPLRRAWARVCFCPQACDAVLSCRIPRERDGPFSVDAKKFENGLLSDLIPVGAVSPVDGHLIQTMP